MGRLLSIREVCEQTGLSKPTIHRLRNGKYDGLSFPEPRQISAGRVAWLEADIEAWQSSLRRTRGEPIDRPAPRAAQVAPAKGRRRRAYSPDRLASSLASGGSE
jgi:predicted DNA-binding transcriptional regulator AlpA